MRRRSALVGLMAGAALLSVGAVGPAARAQDAPAVETGETQFGIYQLEARGLGIEASYEMEDLLPGGTPVLDLAIPETLARSSSGPSGYGLASLAYPGGILVNLPSLLDQMGEDGSQVPPYPIKAEAFFPSGPTEDGEAQPGGAEQRVVTGELGVEAAGRFPGVSAPPAVDIGSITSASRTEIVDGLAVSRSRVELGRVDVLGGLITIESVVTDLVVAHDGTNGAPAGGTRVSGVRFLGLAAELTSEGLVLSEPPPVEGPAAPLGGLLDPATGPLRDALAPVQDALRDVLEQAVPQVDDLLAQAGVTISVAKPQDLDVESGATARASSGLSIELSFKGREQQQLVDLINSIPDDLKPDLGPIPFPVAFLAENHITGFNLAPAMVSSLASPPFELGEFGDFAPPADFGVTDPGAGGDLGASDFETEVPAIPAPGDGDGLGDIDEAGSLFDGAIPAALVALVLLGAPLFGLGSTRLADNVLAPTSTHCPTGQDRPPPARRT